FLPYLTSLWTFVLCEVGDTQERCRSGHRGISRTHNLYITGGCRRKHVGFKDLTTHGRYCWRLTLPRLFSLFLFLPSTIVVLHYAIFLQRKCAFLLLAKMGVRDIV